MRDSFIFYRSFYEAIKHLDGKIQGEIYTAIMEYSLYGKEVELGPVAKSLFTLIKPQIDVNNQRFENGKKGGRKTKHEPNNNQSETKCEPNKNVNVNDNVNKNDNDNKNNTPLNPPPGETSSKKVVKGGKEFLLNELSALVNPELMKPYQEYIQMRIEIRKPFKSLSALKKNYELLMKLANNNINTAKKILFNSVANQWQGIFPLKTETKQPEQAEKLVYPGEYSIRDGIDKVDLEERSKVAPPPPNEFFERLMSGVNPGDG